MIRVAELTKRYGPVVALDEVSFDVQPRERVVIAGASGSGKTTLLRLVAGLERPDAGTVVEEGRTVVSAGHATPPSRRSIGVAFQRPALWPHMSVEANVRFGLSGLSRNEARTRTAGLLEAVELAGLGRRRPDELSEGQARRVALARALAPRPRLLLMDEPLANLDPPLKARMLDLVRAEADAMGATLLYVAHEPDEVVAFGGRVLRLERGRLAAGAAPEGVR